MNLGSTSVTITVDGVDKTLVKIDSPNFGAQYYLREATQDFTLNVRHSREAIQKDGTRFDRHNVELINVVFATETTPARSRVAYTVMRNKRDDDYTAVADLNSALIDALDGVAIADLLAWKN